MFGEVRNRLRAVDLGFRVRGGRMKRQQLMGVDILIRVPIPGLKLNSFGMMFCYEMKKRENRN